MTAETILAAVNTLLVFVLVWITTWYAYSTKKMVDEMQLVRITEHERLLREKSELHSNLSTLLSLEVDQNIELLEKTRDQMLEGRAQLESGPFANLQQRSPEDQEALTRKLLADLAMRLAMLPLPQWRRTVWDSHPLQLAQALSEDRLKRVHRLYGLLDKEVDIRRRILAADTERQSRRNAEMLAKVRSQTTADEEFSVKAGELWREWEVTVGEVLKEGNPLTH